MAKVLMISTNLMEDPYPVYPLGATLVASATRQASHEVQFIDLLVDGYEHLDTCLKDFKPEYIALSMRNVDNVNYNDPTSFIAGYRNVIDHIRKHISSPIILGGSAFTIFPEKFLAYLDADYGISGPGEISLPELIDSLEKREVPEQRVIKGKSDVSKNNAYYLNRIPHLADFYLKQGGMLNVFTKKGCPHQCLYCSYPSLEGNQYIHRDAANVVDEIEYLIQHCAADFIFFTDSVFNDVSKKYLQIMEEMLRRDMSIPWSCYMRPAHFEEDEIRLMKQTGLHSVEWGTDCSSNSTLTGMGKGFNWDLVKEANNKFAAHGIPGSHFIIFGGPNETIKTLREGIENLAGLDECVVFAGIGVRVFPNTGICDLALKDGLIKSEEELFDKEVYYFSQEIDKDQMHEELLEAFSDKRHWFYPWAGFAERNRFIHNSGMRGPLWDLILKRKKR